jgi:hypothetical protein
LVNDKRDKRTNSIHYLYVITTDLYPAYLDKH